MEFMASRMDTVCFPRGKPGVFPSGGGSSDPERAGRLSPALAKMSSVRYNS